MNSFTGVECTIAFAQVESYIDNSSSNLSNEKWVLNQLNNLVFSNGLILLLKREGSVFWLPWMMNSSRFSTFAEKYRGWTNLEVHFIEFFKLVVLIFSSFYGSKRQI